MKKNRISSRPEIRYTLLRIASEEEILTMGEHGEMNVQSAETESVRSRNEILSRNGTEYERSLRGRSVWEARLRDSPLDKKLQDFVAYHQDVIRRFEEWFASEKITLPCGSGTPGAARGAIRADRDDRA